MKMSSRTLVSSVIVLLAFLTISEGIMGNSLNCRCAGTESRRIGKLIEKIELLPPNSHCADTEIIATLKETGQELCLNRNAPWVKKVIEGILAKKKP